MFCTQFMMLYWDFVGDVSFLYYLSGHAHFGVFLWSTRRRGASFTSVPNLKLMAQFVQKLLSGSQNLEIRSRDPGHANFYNLYAGRVGPLSMPNLKWIALYVQKLWRGSQIFEIGSRDSSHAHLRVDLWSGRSRGPSSMSVANLKWISLFVLKL